jgi:hypothetical protein
VGALHDLSARHEFSIVGRAAAWVGVHPRGVAGDPLPSVSGYALDAGLPEPAVLQLRLRRTFEAAAGWTVEAAAGWTVEAAAGWPG